MTTPRAWLSMQETADRFGVDVSRVRECMAAPASVVEPSFVNIGTLAKPRWSFEVARVDAWWRGANAWRLSVSSDPVSGKSDGTSLVPEDHAPRRPALPRTRDSATNSSAPSPGAKPSGSATSQAKAAARLRSVTA